MEFKKINEIVWTDISKLKKNPKNNNKHSLEQVERLAKIIKYQGFRTPIVVSNLSGLIVSGHARLQAAKKIGMEKVPVSFQDFENEAQEFAHMTADNAVALWADLDIDSISDYAKDLDLDLDLDFLGVENLQFAKTELFDLEDEKSSSESTKKITVEVEFNNSHERDKLYEELLGRNFLAKVRG